MMATTASLGMVLLWDVDGGLQQIDKFLYSSDDYIKAGLFSKIILNTFWDKTFKIPSLKESVD